VYCYTPYQYINTRREFKLCYIKLNVKLPFKEVGGIYLIIIETITILVDWIVVLVKVAVGDRVVPKPTTPG
jgi:hypothetical protein